MLSYNPAERLSLTEIKAHDWFNGTVPSHEEIKEEFDQRNEILTQNNDQQDQPLPNTQIDVSVFQQNTVLRSGEEAKEDVKIPDFERNCAEYIPEFKRYTEFFSTSSVDDLFKTVGIYAKENAKSFEFDDEEYSATMKLSSDTTPVELKVNILQVDEDKHCIEVVKEKGERFAFSAAYNDIKKFFGGHANTTA